MPVSKLKGYALEQEGDSIWKGYRKLAVHVLARAVQDWQHPNYYYHYTDPWKPSKTEIREFIWSKDFNLWYQVRFKQLPRQKDRQQFCDYLENL